MVPLSWFAATALSVAVEHLLHDTAIFPEQQLSVDERILLDALEELAQQPRAELMQFLLNGIVRTTLERDEEQTYGQLRRLDQRIELELLQNSKQRHLEENTRHVAVHCHAVEHANDAMVQIGRVATIGANDVDVRGKNAGMREATMKDAR